ncbi:hypothetical protein D3C77_182040 [compost metagenome]
MLQAFLAIGRRSLAQQGPASGVLHAAERGAATATVAAPLALAGRGDQRPQAGKAVGTDQPGGDQRLQGVFQLAGQQVGVMHQLIEEQGAVFTEHRIHPLRLQAQVAALQCRAQRSPQPQAGTWQQHQWRAAQGGGRCTGRQASPRELAGAAGFIQPSRVVVLDAAGQQVGLPGTCRCGITLELFQHFAERSGALQARGRAQVLPVEQKAHEILQADRLYFPAQALDRVAVDTCQQVPFAPLQVRGAGAEVAAHHIAFGFQARQCLFEVAHGQLQGRGDLRQGQWAKATEACAQQFNQRGVGIQGLIETGQCRNIRYQRRVRVQRAQQCQALPGKPQPLQATGSPCARQFIKPRLPAGIGRDFALADAAQAHQRFMHFITAGRRRPGFGFNRRDGVGIQGTQVVAALHLVPASVEHSLGAPFFQRRIVEKGVGAGIENGRRQGRRGGQVTADQSDPALFDTP